MQHNSYTNDYTTIHIETIIQASSSMNIMKMKQEIDQTLWNSCGSLFHSLVAFGKNNLFSTSALHLISFKAVNSCWAADWLNHSRKHQQRCSQPQKTAQNKKKGYNNNVLHYTKAELHSKSKGDICKCDISYNKNETKRRQKLFTPFVSSSQKFSALSKYCNPYATQAKCRSEHALQCGRNARA